MAYETAVEGIDASKYTEENKMSREINEIIVHCSAKDSALRGSRVRL